MAEDYQRELDRVVDRLRTMPLTRLRPAADLAHQACCDLLALAGVDRELPRLADHAAGDQLAVIGADLLREHGADELLMATATSVLTRLRRTLP